MRYTFALRLQDMERDAIIKYGETKHGRAGVCVANTLPHTAGFELECSFLGFAESGKTENLKNPGIKKET